MKKCTKCKVEKEITKFGVDKQRKDGLYPSCKECSKEYRKENKDKKKEYYKKNKDKIKEYYKENKDKIINKEPPQDQSNHFLSVKKLRHIINF